MKNNWAVTALVFVFIIVAILIIKITNVLWSETGLTTGTNQLNDFHYHFVMIARTTEEIYWKQVHAGARGVADQENAALEYFGTRFLNLKELERFLEMAILSSVDGILVSVPNDPAFQALINEAAVKRIPLVVLATDIETNQKISFVGVNTYDLGFKTGRALVREVTGICRIAVLINSNFSALSYRRYLKGIRAAIQSYPNLKIKLIINSKGESISAEEQTQGLLKNYPEIGAIICSDASDTLGVAKVIVDLNRVAQITIIGCGLTSEIVPYLKRGVIRSVLADNPRALGVQAMLALIRLKQGQSVQETYYMPLYLVDAKNVVQIIKQFNFSE